MTTFTVYRAANVRTDSVIDTITAAQARYADRQHRPATDALLNAIDHDALGAVPGLTITADHRVHPGEVWLTDAGRTL